MWNIKVLDFDFFFIACSFFIYSFAGWIWETCFCSFKRKTFVNRGFLNGPIIPIYGIGGTLVYIMLFKYSTNQVAVFFLGMLLATVLEYLTAVIMETIFHAKWWDYSDYKFNIQGRISLKSSLFWGGLSVVDINVLGPIVSSIIYSFPRQAAELICLILICTSVADLSVTVVYTLQLSQSVHRLNMLREELFTYLLNTKLIEKSSDLKDTLFTATISKLGQKREGMINLLTTRFRASIATEAQPEEVERRVTKFREDVEKRFHQFATKYKLDSYRNNVVHKRLIKAFPNLKFKKGRFYLQELKERFNSKNVKKG